MTAKIKFLTDVHLSKLEDKLNNFLSSLPNDAHIVFVKVNYYEIEDTPFVGIIMWREY